MEIQVFGKTNCDKCHFAEEKIKKYLETNMDVIDDAIYPVEVVFKSMDTPEGLMEGTLRDVSGIPSIFVVKNDIVLYEMRGHVPRKEDLETMLNLVKGE